MASTGSTIVNWFTSESDDFNLMIALLSSTLFQCHWFANRQCSSIHFPLLIVTLWELCMIIPTPHPVLFLIDDSSGSCIYCFAALQAMVSWADTFNGHSLTSVRSDRGGIIYWTMTTLVSLTICRSSLFRPSVSPGVAHQPHIFSHPPHLEWSYREVHLNSTSDNLLYWFTSEFDDSNMKIAQLECLYASPSSSVILLASFGMTPRTTIFA